MKDVYVTVYDKEKGRVEISLDEWNGETQSIMTFHREDGPTMEFASGHKLWWLDNRKYSEDQYWIVIQEVKSMPAELRLTDPRWWVREFK